MNETNKILEHLSLSDTLTLLRTLIDHQVVGQAVTREVKDYWMETTPPDPDLESTAEELFTKLVPLEIEKAWTIYEEEQDAYDMAVETIDKTLLPYVDDLELFLSRRMVEQATSLCQGLLKGLHRYAYEYAMDRFDEHAGVFLADCATPLLYKWGDVFTRKEYFVERIRMHNFIQSQLPGWLYFLPTM